MGLFEPCLANKSAWLWIELYECDLILTGIMEIFLVNLMELIIEIVSQFLFWMSLGGERLSRLLIADILSIRIVIVELIGRTRRRKIIAASSEWEESEKGCVAALNLMDRSFSQIQPIPDYKFGIWIFLIEASV